MKKTAVIIAFVAAQLLDVHSTMLALSQPGVAEANPVMNWLMTQIGVMPAFLAAKCAAIAAVVAFRNKKHWFKTMLVINTLYVIVVINNYSIYI